MTATAFESRLLELQDRFVRGLPGRVEAIAECLRQRQAGRSEPEETLERQFHNLAGTAGTFGFLAIAAVASDGFDACVDLKGRPGEYEARYLWSVVEELEDQASGLTDPDSDGGTILRALDFQGTEDRR